MCDSVGPRCAVGPQVASIRTLSQRDTHSNLSVTAATTTAAGSAGGEGGRITVGQHKRKEGVVEARVGRCWKPFWALRREGNMTHRKEKQNLMGQKEEEAREKVRCGIVAVFLPLFGARGKQPAAAASPKVCAFSLPPPGSSSISR